MQVGPEGTQGTEERSIIRAGLALLYLHDPATTDVDLGGKLGLRQLFFLAKLADEQA